MVIISTFNYKDRQMGKSSSETLHIVNRKNVSLNSSEILYNKSENYLELAISPSSVADWLLRKNVLNKIKTIIYI